MMHQLVFLASAQLAGMMSPGPTTVMVLRSGSQGGRRYARATALGVTSSTAVHVALGAAGLGALLLRHAALASSLRVAGAVYLSYLGGRILHGLLSGSRTAAVDAGTDVDGHSWRRGFREGFLTNLLNPKVTLLYLALFGQLTGWAASTRWIILLALVFVGQSLGYWLLFATLTSSMRFRRLWCRSSRLTEGLFGVLLIAFGVRLVAGG